MIMLNDNVLQLISEGYDPSFSELSSAILQHFNNFWILLLGRLLGGTATSILYSAFESWVIYEHGKVRVSMNSLSSCDFC